MARPPGFRAQYPTICPRCNSEIRKDDRVVRQGGNIIHPGCASGADE